LFILLVLLFFVLVLPFGVFFFTILDSISGSLSLTSRKSFNPCSGFLNHEYGNFSVLMRVICYSVQLQVPPYWAFQLHLIQASDDQEADVEAS
jgi:hypothetical protein